MVKHPFWLCFWVRVIFESRLGRSEAASHADLQECSRQEKQDIGRPEQSARGTKC